MMYSAIEIRSTGRGWRNPWISCSWKVITLCAVVGGRHEKVWHKKSYLLMTISMSHIFCFGVSTLRPPCFSFFTRSVAQKKERDCWSTTVFRGWSKCRIVKNATKKSPTTNKNCSQESSLAKYCRNLAFGPLIPRRKSSPWITFPGRKVIRCTFACAFWLTFVYLYGVARTHPMILERQSVLWTQPIGRLEQSAASWLLQGPCHCPSIPQSSVNLCGS